MTGYLEYMLPPRIFCAIPVETSAAQPIATDGVRCQRAKRAEIFHSTLIHVAPRGETGLQNTRSHTQHTHLFDGSARDACDLAYACGCLERKPLVRRYALRSRLQIRLDTLENFLLRIEHL